jgi:hypothetical protein
VRARPLPADKGGQQGGPPGSRTDHEPRGPAVDGRFDHRPQDQPDGGDRQEHPGQVATQGVGVARVRHEPPGEQRRAEGDRDVDEEHRAPPEVGEQQPADDRAEGEADTVRPGPKPDRVKRSARLWVPTYREAAQPSGSRSTDGRVDGEGPGFGIEHRSRP